MQIGTPRCEFIFIPIQQRARVPTAAVDVDLSSPSTFTRFTFRKLVQGQYRRRRRRRRRRPA